MYSAGCADSSRCFNPVPDHHWSWTPPREPQNHRWPWAWRVVAVGGRRHGLLGGTTKVAHRVAVAASSGLLEVAEITTAKSPEKPPRLKNQSINQSLETQ